MWTFWKKKGVAVFCYHLVCGADKRPELAPLRHVMTPLGDFERHLDLIQSQSTVLPLSAVVDALLSGQPLPARASVITFDDGFRETLSTAGEVLRRRALPATFFVMGEPLRSGRVPWIFRLAWLCAGADAGVLEAEANRAGAVVAGGGDRREAIRAALKDRMRRLPPADACAAMDELASRIPHVPSPSDLFLSAEQVAGLSRDGFEVGCHSMTHPDMVSLDDGGLRDEIGGATEVLRDLCGRPPDLFCYPFGSAGSWSPQTEKALRENGYRAACSTVSGVLHPSTSAFSIPRYGETRDWEGRWNEITKSLREK